MGKRKIECHSTCLYEDKGKCTAPSIKIQAGECLTYKPNLNHYIGTFIDAFGSNAFIMPQNLNKTVRIGAYYAMKVFKLGMTESEWGDWNYISFYALEDEENHKPLNPNEILQREPDTEAYVYLYEKLVNEELPPFSEDKEQDDYLAEQKAIEAIPDNENYGKYGLLSPDGIFYPCKFGDHIMIAHNLVNKYWKEEYKEWLKFNINKNYLDFLQIVKHFILIHNTSCGSPYVSYHPEVPEKLTKKQKDFLYNYFMKIGRTLYAEQFIKEN